MPRNKSVSVILPNYNYAKYIRSRIREVLSQTYPVSEIIILDDASTDGSREIINNEVAIIKKDNPNINVVIDFNKKNSGNVFSQWQKGIELANSDYIWICELDDGASSHFLEKVMFPFSDDKVVLSYCNSKIVDESGKTLLKDNLRRIKDVFRRRHNLGNYTVDGITEINRNLAVYNSIPNVSAAVFKNQSQLVSYLDKSMKYQLCGDWFFYLKVATTGKIAYCNKTLNVHRVHSGSVTSDTDFQKRYQEMQSIHNYAIKSLSLSDETIKRIRSIEAELAKKWKIKDN